MEPSIHAQTHGDDTTRLLKRRACFAQRGTAQTNAYLLTPITTPLPGAAWLLLSGLAAQRTAIDPAEPSGSSVSGQSRTTERTLSVPHVATICARGPFARRYQKGPTRFAPLSPPILEPIPRQTAILQPA
jgi:hypothetical protein